MKLENVEYRIPEHYLSVLLNADCSGLEDGETEEITAFEKSVFDKYGPGHWDVDTDNGPEFGRNDVNSFLGSFYNCKYWHASK